MMLLQLLLLLVCSPHNPQPQSHPFWMAEHPLLLLQVVLRLQLSLVMQNQVLLLLLKALVLRQLDVLKENSGVDGPAD